jgi:hypothetical protein
MKDVDALLQAADRALYRAKAAGRNQVMLAESNATSVRATRRADDPTGRAENPA